MNFKKIMAGAIVTAITISVWAATPQVKNVKVFQQRPWGHVCISYEVEGNIAENIGGEKTPILFVAAKDKTTGVVYGDVSSAESFLSGDTDSAVGLHKVVWDIVAQGVAIDSDNVVFTVAYCVDQPYWVVDLSSGAYSSSYPSSYLYAVPPEGWTDEYKTNKLVLRRITPGSFKMCGQYDVAITKPFYMGIFEVSQKQYTLVMGSNPSDNKDDKNPVNNVSYNMIRGTSNGSQWPSSSAVDLTSFMGRLRTRTGYVFDLPTEAQWEYACRAGTTSSYNNGSDSMSGLAADRYISSPRVVGSYLPNAWGLYNMHGNVGEWCLDWFSDLLTGGTNPMGASSGYKRVLRGPGNYHYGRGASAIYSSQSGSPSTSREGVYPNDGNYGSCSDSGVCDSSYRGFRIAKQLPN